MHVIITGSNAKLLSGELATHLTGRHHSILLYPFSFREYCKMKGTEITPKTTINIAKIRATFDEYVRNGGFPELLAIKDEKTYIDELVNNILKRNIEQRFKIIYTTAFEQLAHHLLNVAPSVIVEKNLQELFELKSQHTAKNYISYLKQAYLLVGLHKYSAKSRQRLIGEKIYPIDVALMNKRNDAFAGENLGWRLETIVYLALLRKYRMKGFDIYYYSERTWECDFIICDGRKTILAVQVSFDISSQKTKNREITGLLKTAKKTGCQNLLLLTDHNEENIEQDGYIISIRPVYDYLLE